MQNDTRRVTVSEEHLRSAYEEITLAQGNAERSIAEAAIKRAIGHLDMVVRKLEEQRARADRTLAATEVERAYQSTRSAWQGSHNAVNHWPESHGDALVPVRDDLIDALDCLTRVYSKTAA